MYLLYALLIVTSFVVCSDLPLVPTSTPPQDIKGRHCRKVSIALTQVSTPCMQGVKKDSPLKASQDDNEDLIEAAIEEMAAQKVLEADDELFSPMDE